MNQTPSEMIATAWKKRRAENPACPAEEFVEDMYLSLHSNDLGTREQKQFIIRQHINSWRAGKHESERTALQAAVPTLDSWKAGVLLDNVIEKLELSFEDRYRYLLNVRLMTLRRLCGERTTQDGVRAIEAYEKDYDQEWDRADTASEAEYESLFSATTGLMSEMGILDGSATRRALAELGAGRNAELPIASFAGEPDEDELLVACFMASEELPDETGTCSSAEVEKLVRDVVPVCVTTTAMAAGGQDAGTMEMVSCLLLCSKLFHKKSLKLIPIAILVAVIAQAAFLVLKTVLVGGAVALGVTACLENYRKRMKGVVTREQLKALDNAHRPFRHDTASQCKEDASDELFHSEARDIAACPKRSEWS